MYTINERTEIIFIYGAENWYTRRTTRIFNDKCSDKNMSHTYVNKLVKKFLETGSVQNITRTNNKILNEAAEIKLLRNFTVNPNSNLLLNP